MLAVLVILFLLSYSLETLANILPTFKVPLLGNVDIYKSPVWGFFSNLIPWFLIFLLYFALYHWIPTHAVNKVASFWSALITSTAWKIATEAFSWYLGSGLSRYEVLYGSLGAVVALMFLIYLISWITLFGAHLSASLQKWIDS